jgi:hypothetical protein
MSCGKYQDFFVFIVNFLTQSERIIFLRAPLYNNSRLFKTGKGYSIDRKHCVGLNPDELHCPVLES